MEQKLLRAKPGTNDVSHGEFRAVPDERGLFVAPADIALALTANPIHGITIVDTDDEAKGAVPAPRKAKQAA